MEPSRATAEIFLLAIAYKKIEIVENNMTKGMVKPILSLRVEGDKVIQLKIHTAIITIDNTITHLTLYSMCFIEIILVKIKHHHFHV
jgi:hypothetical protein